MAKRKISAAVAELPAPTKAGGEYTVLARRYRPQQFSDLVGQEAVARVVRDSPKLQEPSAAKGT